MSNIPRLTKPVPHCTRDSRSDDSRAFRGPCLVARTHPPAPYPQAGAGRAPESSPVLPPSTFALAARAPVRSAVGPNLTAGNKPATQVECKEKRREPGRVSGRSCKMLSQRELYLRWWGVGGRLFRVLRLLTRRRSSRITASATLRGDRRPGLRPLSRRQLLSVETPWEGSSTDLPEQVRTVFTAPALSRREKSRPREKLRGRRGHITVYPP